MLRGQPLVRTRTQQERMRRRLLLKGIPLFAVGVAFAWSINHFTSPKIEQDAQSNASSSPLTADFTTPIMADSDSLNHSQKDVKPPNTLAEIATVPPEMEIETEAETTVAESPPNNNPSTRALPDAANTQDVSNTNVTVTTTANTVETEITTANIVETETTTANTVETETTAAVSNDPNTEALANTENDRVLKSDSTTVAIIEPEIAAPKPPATNVPKVALPKNFDSLSDSRLVKAHAPAVTYVSHQTLSQLTPSGNAALQRTVNNTGNISSNSGNTERGRRGWIYAGRFSNGTWVERGLLIDNKLPTPGQSYQLSWGAKLRDNPPGRSLNNGNALGDEIGFLNSGKSIQVVQVRNSGNSGHIWLQVRH